MNKALTIKDELGFENSVRIITSKNGKVVRQTDWMKNKVVLSDGNGRNLVLQALAGLYTDSLAITHLEIGTGTTAATDNDTDTETYVARAERRYEAVAANVMNLKFYLADASLADGSYTELTMWIDGEAGEGTGSLFNRLVFSSNPYIKASGEDTTIQLRVTMTG